MPVQRRRRTSRSGWRVARAKYSMNVWWRRLTPSAARRSGLRGRARPARRAPIRITVRRRTSGIIGSATSRCSPEERPMPRVPQTRGRRTGSGRAGGPRPRRSTVRRRTGGIIGAPRRDARQRSAQCRAAPGRRHAPSGEPPGSIAAKPARAGEWQAASAALALAAGPSGRAVGGRRRGKPLGSIAAQVAARPGRWACAGVGPQAAGPLPRAESPRRAQEPHDSPRWARSQPTWTTRTPTLL
jgi:hypothetical protein